jgi:hypothetical protein
VVGAAYCFLGFLLAFVGARRSFGRGLFWVFASGYVYGLLRAHFVDGLTHFGFDAAIIGTYFGRFSVTSGSELDTRDKPAVAWATLLIAWPAFVMAYSQAFDSQPLIIQLVGLRPMLVFMPMLIVGARLTREDFDYLAPRVAALNIAVFGVAAFEFVFGVERVIPHNMMTEIVYQSSDVFAEGAAYKRIPATFIHAHVYGFMMLTSIPFVAHGLESARREKLICAGGIGAAILGIFMCGARMPVVFVGLSTVYVLMSLRVRTSTWFAFLGAGGLGLAAALSNERLQRFQTLADTDMVELRIRSSVNLDFFDLLAQYPLGNGLARGWGTAIPYFMQAQALPQVGTENEFGRIVIDTGIPGLIIWLAFFVWTMFQKDHSDSSPIMKMFAWPLTTLVIVGATLGVGLFTAIPVSPILMLLIGVRTTPAPVTAPDRALRLIGRRPAPPPLATGRAATGRAAPGRGAPGRALRPSPTMNGSRRLSS